jgi:hypothetical protein
LLGIVRLLGRDGRPKEEGVEEIEGVRMGRGDGGGSASGPRLVHGSIELCDAAKGAISPAPGQGRARSTVTNTEAPMQHFHVGNLEKIKDSPPNTWATVHCRDVVTLSELARRGFHLVDMSGEVWTMRRAG